MAKLYDQYGKEIPVARKKINKKVWTSGKRFLLWFIPVAIALIGLLVGISQWRRDHAPDIGFLGVSVEGIPGKTAVRFQTNYQNVGKSDALNLKSHSRRVPRNESRFPPSDLKGFKSSGKVAPGEKFHSEPCDLILEMSLALAMPQFDNDPLLYLDHLEWDDEYGKHYKYDHCLIWDRRSMDFVQCPSEP